MQTLINYLLDTGFAQLQWANLVMIAIGLVFIWLAIVKKFEPLLLVPIGFGILIGNIPYDSAKLSLGVYDGPVGQDELAYYALEPIAIETDDGLRYTIEPGQAINELDRGVGQVNLDRWLATNQAVMVNAHSLLSIDEERLEGDGPQIVEIGQGRAVFVAEAAEHVGEKYPQVWSRQKQDPTNASVFWWLFTGVGLAGFYPPLIFLGVGALTDFGPLLARPKTILLGAAAQFGIFAALLGALALGKWVPGIHFGMNEAASIGIIGGADGPTSIFVCAKLAPDLLGPVALAAYSYMAMVPIIQPPIMRLLTSKKERMIRMHPPQNVSRRMKIVFPIAGFLLTAFIAPGALPLLGMLFFGNLLKESLVTDRLAKTAQTAFIDIVTILLGVTVGAKTSASSFLTLQTIGIFVLGLVAFAIATASGLLFAKAMNKLSREPINPLIGAAGVSAVPMAARVCHQVAQKDDPQNFLIMHAMGPNVAGVIGSAVAAGVLLSSLLG